MESFRGLLEALPDATLVLDSRGCIRLANAAACRLLGYGGDELCGAHVSLVHLESAQPGVQDLWSRAVVGKLDAPTQTVCLRGKAGQEVVAELTMRRAIVNGEDVCCVVIRQRQGSQAETLGTRLFEETMAAWNVGMFEHDLIDGRSYSSPRFLEVFGFAPGDQPSLEDILTRVHPQDRAVVEAHSNALLAPDGQDVFDLTHRVLRPDGAVRFVHVLTRLEYGEVDGQPRPVRVLGSMRDVTKKQELSLALQRNEARLELAIELSRVGIFDREILPHEGSTPYWSPSMRTMLGYPMDAPADPEWFRLRVHPHHLRQMEQAISRANDGDGNVEVEVCWQHPGGGLRWFLIRSRTLFTEDTLVSGRKRSIGALLDITERRLFEEEIRQRSEILDATPDFVAIVDRKGRLVYLNHAGRRFVGIASEHTLLGFDVWRIFTEVAQDYLRTHATLDAVRDGVWRGDTDFVRHDLAVVPMSQVILAHRDPSGHVTHFSTIARDLSREKQLEAQFMQSQKMEAIGRLAGGVAHDFNNLLSVILGSCELAMLDLDEAHPSWRELEQVGLAGQRAAAVTRQLLAFGRKQILKPTVLDVHEVLRDVTAMLKRLVDDTIELHIIPGEAPTSIRADRTQVQQILLNLVVNARDAMPTGGDLTVTSERRWLDDERLAESLQLPLGEYAVLRVHDTGLGMTSDVRERLFEPFFTTKGPGQGTGLGLSTVFGIVSQSGGGIVVDSEPGKGATFEVLLPCIAEAPTAVVEPPVATVHEARSRRVLVAEDDEQLRNVISQVLSRVGYEVYAAADGIEALRMSRRLGPWLDLLLTDVLMPGMTGKQLADAMAKERPEMLTLFMSGYTEDSIVDRGVLDPSVNFIAKPITPRRLLEAIARVLGDRVTGEQS